MGLLLRKIDKWVGGLHKKSILSTPNILRDLFKSACFITKVLDGKLVAKVKIGTENKKA